MSIDVGTDDSWCQTMCASTTDNPLQVNTCPEKTCRCDDESTAQARQEHDEVSANLEPDPNPNPNPDPNPNQVIAN